MADFYVGGVTRSSSNSLLTEVNEERTVTSALSSGQSATWQSKLAIANVTDFTKACLSTSVYSIDSAYNNQTTFKNNCWMLQGGEEWLLNAKLPQILGIADAWHIYGGQRYRSYLVTSSYNIRPVIYIKEDTILSGSGTLEEPFNVEENWDWFDNGQVLK